MLATDFVSITPFQLPIIYRRNINSNRGNAKFLSESTSKLRLPFLGRVSPLTPEEKRRWEIPGKRKNRLTAEPTTGVISMVSSLYIFSYMKVKVQFCFAFVCLIIPDMESDFANPHMPLEICTQILSYLPVKSLLRFRSVSKKWKSIIDDPSFATLHVSHCSNNRLESHAIILECHCVQMPRSRFFSRCPVTLDYHQTSVTEAEPLIQVRYGLTLDGDVNGLVLMRKFLYCLCEGDLFLWNPSIKKMFNIPLTRSLGFVDCPDRIHLSLGFDPSTNDYKVVAMTIHPHLPDITLEIFSLNSRTWRWKESFNHNREEFGRMSSKRNRVCLGGVTHWIAFELHHLVSFDMTSETLSYTPLPDISPYIADGEYRLHAKEPVVVGGSLIGLLISWYGFTDIWVLGDDDGQWRKTFTFNSIFERWWGRVFCLSNDGVIFWEGRTKDHKIICASDVYTGKTSLVSQCRYSCSSCQLIWSYGRDYNKSCPSCHWLPDYLGAYVESLVLLNDRLENVDDGVALQRPLEPPVVNLEIPMLDLGDLEIPGLED